MKKLNEMSDEAIEREISGEAVRGPRIWRGRPVASLSRGLRDLHWKVMLMDVDTAVFHDAALLYILTEAHSEDDGARLAKRRKLMAETDDAQGFRAKLSLFLDELTDEELIEARTVVEDILGIVKKAEVVVEKKSDSLESAETNRTRKGLKSGRSAVKPGGRQTSSAGT